MPAACEITHPQITAGTCPWCGHLVGASDRAPNVTERIWNVAAMAAALDDPNVDVRSMTVTNLWRKGPPADAAVSLLSKALTDSSSEIRHHAAHGLSRLGRDISADDVRRFEEQIPGSPHELGLRILALGYYFLGQRESESARAARQEHIFWLIRHAPECDTAGSPESSLYARDDQDAYAKAKQLWLAQIDSHPENTSILGNAARFFLLDDWETSETLLKRARDLEPANPEWSERLGHLYSLQSGHRAPGAQVHARSALEELRHAEQLRMDTAPNSPGEMSLDVAKVRSLLERIYKLPQLAKAAFEAREVEEARNYAMELLEKAASPDLPEFFRNSGNAVHHGNLILGRIALQSGDLAQAREWLIAAARTSGSPQLNSFGPNMSLAKELLERGERDAVLEYFALCAKFWKHGAETLAAWTDQVRAGEMPDFRANLRY
ncbi:MAG: HEAT repeat domain-containing protein [Deltaproteobacteria bacterium]